MISLVYDLPVPGQTLIWMRLYFVVDVLEVQKIWETSRRSLGNVRKVVVGEAGQISWLCGPCLSHMAPCLKLVRLLVNLESMAMAFIDDLRRNSLQEFQKKLENLSFYFAYLSKWYLQLRNMKKNSRQIADLILFCHHTRISSIWWKWAYWKWWNIR